MVRNRTLMEVRQAIPFAVPFCFAFAVYSASVTPILLSGVWATIGICSIFAVLLVSTIILTVYGTLNYGTEDERISMSVTPVSLVAGAYLVLLFVDMSEIRFAITTGCMLLIAAFFARMDVANDDGFRNLARTIRLIAFFFMLVFAYGISLYAHIPALVLALMVGITAGAGAIEEFRKYIGLNGGVRIGAIVGIMSAELYLVIALLPLHFLTDAALTLVIMHAIMSVLRRIIRSTDMPRIPHKQLIASGMLIIGLLGTATWT